MIAWTVAMELLSRECQRIPMIRGPVPVMAWYRQAISYYLSQCWWLISMSPHGVTMPQWVKWIWADRRKQLSQPWIIEYLRISIMRGSKCQPHGDSFTSHKTSQEMLGYMNAFSAVSTLWQAFDGKHIAYYLLRHKTITFPMHGTPLL